MEISSTIEVLTDNLQSTVFSCCWYYNARRCIEIKGAAHEWVWDKNKGGEIDKAICTWEKNWEGLWGDILQQRRKNYVKDLVLCIKKFLLQKFHLSCRYVCLILVSSSLEELNIFCLFVSFIIWFCYYIHEKLEREAYMRYCDRVVGTEWVPSNTSWHTLKKGEP